MIKKVSASQLIPENLLLYDLDKENHILQVEIDPIDFCNHNCGWCFTAELRHKQKISLKKLRSYLTSFCDLGGKSVVFSGGGEPLLYREIYSVSEEFDTKSICKFLIDKGIAVGIITNGYLLDKLFNSDFIVTDLSFVRVSLDATNEVSHSELHNTSKSDYTKIINNIKTILNYRANNFTPAIGLSYVVDGINNINFSRDQIELINKLACSLSVDFVQFKHIHTSEKESAIANMNIVHSYCVNLNWAITEFWVQSFDSANTTLKCLISQYIQSVGNQSKKFPCCHLFGRTEFLDQDTFLPKGKIITNCDNKVCRYNEMNKILLDDFIHKKETHKQVLEASLSKDGFHPFRYCPTAPNILQPYKSQ
ncbi:MAG TPA: radical SAM protein [Paludibacter sp.]